MSVSVSAQTFTMKHFAKQLEWSFVQGNQKLTRSRERDLQSKSK